MMMSEDMKPEVLPGDLISGPGVYISRSNCAVEVRGYDHGYWKAEWEDGARWYHSSGTQTGLPARDDPYQLVRWVGPLAEDIPTTSEQIAEPEPQADYTPTEGWRLLQVGETITLGDRWIRPDDRQAFDASRVGHSVSERMCYIRRMEQPEPEPEVENCGFEGKILREVSQPVQVREGRWRTRNGEVRHVTPTPEARKKVFNQSRYSWYDAQHNQTWLPSGHYTLGGESQWDLLEYLGPVEPEPEQTISPNDVAAEALAGVFDQGKAERQIAELRSEVSHVQGLLGDERRRFTELETLVADLRAVNAAQEKAINSAARDKADLQHRLDTVAAEWAVQAETIRGLQTQLEAVKAEVSQVSRDRYLLQVELDAREQVPEAVSDRFDQGFEQGTARAVETIAEWTVPFRTCGSQALAYHVMQNLPHIMRTLTGLTDED